MDDLILIMNEIRGRSGLKDFKFALMILAKDIGTPYSIAKMLDFVMFGKGRDGFQYTRIEAARTLISIAPQLPECSQVLELIRSAEREGASAFGAARGVLDALKQALLKRADELGCLSEDPKHPQNKP